MAGRVKDQLRPEDLDDPRLGGHDAGNAASQVAQFSGVRQALFDFQLGFANTPPDGAPGAVIDGRDIGTVIAPDADVKLYITASPEIRAGRRFRQLHNSGADVAYEDVLQDMHARDKRDAGRDNAPMQQAEDAHVIDTSELDIEAAYEAVTTIVYNRLATA
jgi:cytidylate kinase